jgi:tRNA(Ile2) C34 agmatinyltransferase TiaS
MRYRGRYRLDDLGLRKANPTSCPQCHGRLESAGQSGDGESRSKDFYCRACGITAHDTHLGNDVQTTYSQLAVERKK